MAHKDVNFSRDIDFMGTLSSEEFKITPIPGCHIGFDKNQDPTQFRGEFEIGRAVNQVPPTLFGDIVIPIKANLERFIVTGGVLVQENSAALSGLTNQLRTAANAGGTVLGTFQAAALTAAGRYDDYAPSAKMILPGSTSNLYLRITLGLVGGLVSVYLYGREASTDSI